MASDGGDLRETVFVLKTSDESTATDATLNDDSQLSVAVAANEIVRVELWASAEWNGGGIQCAFNGPAAATNFEYWIQINRDDGTVYLQQSNGVWDSVVLVAPDVARIGLIKGVVLLENGANAGNVVFRWCQQASHANNTVITRGSHIEMKRYS